MVNKDIVIAKIRDFLFLELENMSKASPIMAFSKPVLKRIIEANYCKLNSIICLLADQNGNVDFEGLLSDMTTSFLNTDRFTYHTDIIGDIIIGGGEVRLTLPVLNKGIVFNTEDLKTLSQMVRG